MLSLFSLVQLFASLWIRAHQAPLSTGFSRQEYWSGLSCHPAGHLPDPGFEPKSFISPVLAGGFFFFFFFLQIMQPGKLKSNYIINYQSVQFSRSVVSDFLWHHESQHGRPPCPSPTPGVYPNPYPSSWWCHPAISSSVIPSSSCPKSFLALGSFTMSQLFTWGGQSTGVSASASVLPMNTPLEWTAWISLQPEGISRVFSNTTVQKHQFFGAQLSSHPPFTSINDYWENHSLD